MPKRIFIVAPTGSEPEDTLHHVCSTNRRDRLSHVYFLDLYTEEHSTDNLPDAITKAKELGAKRPTII